MHHRSRDRDDERHPEVIEVNQTDGGADGYQGSEAALSEQRKQGDRESHGEDVRSYHREAPGRGTKAEHGGEGPQIRQDYPAPAKGKIKHEQRASEHPHAGQLHSQHAVRHPGEGRHQEVKSVPDIAAELPEG